MGALFILICIAIFVIWLILSPFFSKIGNSVSKFGPKDDEANSNAGDKKNIKETVNGKEEKSR